MTPRYLNGDDTLLALDAGVVEIVATFADGHKEKNSYLGVDKIFADWFNIIRKMVPSCENVPVVLTMI